jgi:hypothetical protein
MCYLRIEKRKTEKRKIFTDNFKELIYQTCHLETSRSDELNFRIDTEVNRYEICLHWSSVDV